MTRSEKDRAREALSLLSRQYRERPGEGGTPILDQLVYLILRHGLNPKQARGAFNRLKNEFVDWNEVRVTSSLEIEDSFAGVLAERDRAGKATELKDFLNQVFERQHRVNMDYLVGWDPADVEKFLHEMEALKDSDVHQVLSGLFADDRSPISQNVLRVVKRVGVVPKAVLLERAREELEALVGKQDLARVNFLLYQHAAAICREKDPDCYHCVLSHLCLYGMERLRKGRKEASMAKAKTKKAATKTGTKAATKKAAKKPAAKKAKPAAKKAVKKPAKKAAAKKKK